MREYGIYDKPDLRMMVEGMLYRKRAGCPWRDLPPEFGLWNSVFQKFTRYDKLKRNYESMLALACGYRWLPM